MTQPPLTLVEAREQFLALVEGVRPELHRYCARLTGSVIEGEDIVQDTLAKAFYALSQAAEVPPLRPWLFRIAHNAALDFLKSHGRRYTDAHAELEEIAGFEDKPDPAVVRAVAQELFAAYDPPRPVRLLGVRVAALTTGDQAPEPAGEDPQLRLLV